MDPISSSSFNIHVNENEKEILKEQKQRELFNEMIISRSLSYYEGSKIKTVLPQILATAIAGSLQIVVGISFAYSAILIPQLTQAQKDGDADAIPISQTESSWIASCLPLTAPVGALAGGFIMDSIGRLNTLKLSVIPSVVGWILIATATNFPMMLAGRMLTGISSVWGVSPGVVYITEIGRADIRGSLVTASPIYVSLGMVLGYLKGWFLHWRLVAWLCTFYSVIPIFLIMFIPESPAWLVTKDRIKEAKRSLEWLNRFQPQLEHKSETVTEMQLAALQKEHMLKMEEQGHMVGSNFQKKLKMFVQPTAYKPLLILSGLCFFQQFSGIFIMLFYAISFFKDIGTDVNPYLASTFLGLVRLTMSIVSAWLMKRFNRRSLFMASAAGMAVFGAISGLYTKWIHEGTTTHNWVPVCMLVLYILSSMVGVLPIPFLTIAEMFPIAIRGVGYSIVFSVLNLMMFAALYSYYSLHYLFGGASGIQFFFAIISLGGLVYSFIFQPETHRKKLADIEEYFWHHTTYLTVRSDEKRDDRRKPIVKNIRFTGKDFKAGNKEQMENIMQDKV